mmetsp:Transcript_2199/g.6515  ORF Transcript_2199/g.6515 Transcript_2199/m.6515 type:complete len:304 (+) Transcript_2199:1108-2019(+)
MEALLSCSTRCSCSPSPQRRWWVGCCLRGCRFFRGQTQSAPSIACAGAAPTGCRLAASTRWAPASTAWPPSLPLLLRHPRRRSALWWQPVDRQPWILHGRHQTLTAGRPSRLTTLSAGMPLLNSGSKSTVARTPSSRSQGCSQAQISPSVCGVPTARDRAPPARWRPPPPGQLLPHLWSCQPWSRSLAQRSPSPGPLLKPMALRSLPTPWRKPKWAWTELSSLLSCTRGPRGPLWPKGWLPSTSTASVSGLPTQPAMGPGELPLSAARRPLPPGSRAPWRSSTRVQTSFSSCGCPLKKPMAPR